MNSKICPKCGSSRTEPLRGKTYCNSCGALTETPVSWGQYIAHTLTGYTPGEKVATDIFGRPYTAKRKGGKVHIEAKSRAPS